MGNQNRVNNAGLVRLLAGIGAIILGFLSLLSTQRVI